MKKVLNYKTAITYCLIISYVFLWFSSDPLLHWENFIYLKFLATNNNGGWISASKVFDVCAMEACFDRFRPLGSLFHLIDAFFIFKFPEIIRFRSISHLISGLITAFFLFKAFRLISDGSKERSTWFSGILAAYSLMLPPLLVVNTMFFRPGKLISICFLSYAFYSLIKYRSTYFLSKDFFKLTFIFSISGLIDEQAVFIIFYITGLLTILYIYDKKYITLLCVGVFSSLFQILSMKLFAPIAYKFYASREINYSAPSPFNNFQFSSDLFSKAIYKILNDFSLIFGEYNLNHTYLRFIVVFLIIFFICIILYKIYLIKKLFISLVIVIYTLISLFSLYYMMALAHLFVVLPDSYYTGYYNLVPVFILYILFAIGIIKFNVINTKLSEIIVSIAILFFSSQSIINLRHSEVYYSHRLPVIAEFDKFAGWDESKIIGQSLLDGTNISNDDLKKISPHGANFIDFYKHKIRK